ncbi:DsbA family protein [Aliishimia ponticola]|uniref:DsbA family protein n=1 Tax=Aliishimia ponticola TaxID=2499833 RepID=A0A4V6S243_9RHOB|nr:DsbA family protein [Aliishimia ponticola]THH38953.1 DsbA family protein [Aliishimia ponticola]
MLRALSVSVLALGFALPAQAFDPAAMSDADKEAFGQAVRSYLIENPQVIMEAVAVLEQQQAEAQAAAEQSLVSDNAAAIFDDGYSFVGGNPDGDITLVEFLDYRCGYCRKSHPEVAKLVETDKNIRLIRKEFPILGEQSLLASRFAIATKQVAGSDAYKQVSDAMMTFDGEFSNATLTRIANGFGLDAQAITARMNDDSVTDEIRQTRALAQLLQITGTPTFVVQDEMIRGYVPYDQLTVIVDDKRG